MRTFYRTLRILSVITLFFFCWTFLPLWQAVAYAAEPTHRAESKAQRAERQGPGSGVQTAGERFEKTIEAVREHIGKAEEKSRKGKEPVDEINAIKSKRAEIESIDAELKAEFAATEKKLKDAHLPAEILDRHHKFVKHYQDNLKELIANLTSVEKSADNRAHLEKALSKTKGHLEKTRPPRRHKALDPNKLPNRMVKAKAKAPRTRPEEFRKEFGPGSRGKGHVARGQWIQDAGYTIQDIKEHASVLSGHELTSPITAFGDRFINTNGVDVIQSTSPLQRFDSSTHKRFNASKPILVASNGSLDGLLPSSSPHQRFDASTQHAFTHAPIDASAPLLLAQAVTNPPTADDLSQTPEVQFTPDIQALATQLNHNPVKIYEWVRNNIEYAPTYGSIQGADQCLQSKICNDMDTASLLIALLRTSGIYSHYVYGTIEVPIEKAMNWVGGVTDPKMAGTILSTNGIPTKVLISGSTIKTVQLEHVWVNAFVDYIPSRGAVQRQGNTWIRLDASYKQYNYSQGIDIRSVVPFDAQSFANAILSTATTNTTDGSVTKVNSTLVQQTMQDYQTRVLSYIQQNYPTATVGDVIGKKEIIQQNYPILIGTLPFKTVQVGSEFSTVPDNLREMMSFSIPDTTGGSAGLSYTTGMSQIAGKKITLSFSPATANDQAVIKSLLPQPNPDGTPIQLSQLPSSIPAYLVNLVPELRIDGQVMATGAPIIMGSANSFTMSLNEPGIGISNINYIVTAGQYSGIGVDTGRIGAGCLNALKTKLDSTRAILETQTYAGLTKDDLVGDILYATIASYFTELDAADELTAQTTNIIRYRAPSVGMFSFELNISETFGVPTSAGPKAMILDVRRIMQAVFSKDGSIDKVKQYMLSSGSNSSALEHAVLEQLFSTPTNPVQGISAVKALKIANDQGIPIYVINQSNINTILPMLQLNDDVKTDIQNAVNAGKIVNVQKTNVTYNGWIGCGYIIIDPNTGAGAYMISDGLNGGRCGFEYWFWTVMLAIAWVALIALVVLILPELIAGLLAIAESLSTVYLLAGISTASYIARSDLLRPLYDVAMGWAEYSPPPAPFPTTLEQVFAFYCQYWFLFFYNLYHETYGAIYNSIEYAYYSIQNWKFAMKHAILTCRLC